MRPLHLFLIGSLAVNTVLAGFWFKSKRATSSTESASEAGTATAGLSTKKTKPTSGSDLEGAATDLTVSEIKPVTWLDIQSTDLKEFVTKLRAAGCPDETVKDIILAEVNRRFAIRQRDIWPEQTEDYKFWRVDKRNAPEQAKKQRAQSRQYRDLQKEKSALLVDLLGYDPELQQRIEEGNEDIFVDWQERQISFLPESKRQAALKILEEFQEKEQEMYTANQGLWDAQSRAEQRQMQTDKLAALAQVLSPDELREYELRQSQTATQLSHDLRSLTVNRTEYETIFDIRKKYGDSIYNYGDLEGAEAQKQAEENKKAMYQELTAALGTDKFKEYERSQDYYYQQLQHLAKRNDLPPDTAGKVYDYKSIAEDGAKALRNNKDLSAEQRQTALANLRAETENTLEQTLGEKGYKSYVKNGGWWINNIAPQRSSASGFHTSEPIIIR